MVVVERGQRYELATRVDRAGGVRRDADLLVHAQSFELSANGIEAKMRKGRPVVPTIGVKRTHAESVPGAPTWRPNDALAGTEMSAVRSVDELER